VSSTHTDPVSSRAKETPPTLRVVETPTKANEELRTTLDEVLQRGTLKMLHETLEAEVEEYIRRHREARDARGRAEVVRNGKAPARRSREVAPWPCVRLASMIAALLPTVSGTVSPARFFPATCAGRGK
jgi:hypothetical protein